MNKKYILLLNFLLIFAACKYSDEFKEVITNNQYSISFPDYMTEENTKKLSKEATVQYVSYFRNRYVIVTEKTKNEQNSILNLAKKNKNDLVKMMANPQQIDSLHTTINDLPALRMSLLGTVGVGEVAERIYYHLVFIEGKKANYQLTIWCWDGRKDHFLADLEKIVTSFKEL